ncbi:MAG: penicillin-insensitive murein endopeptidase, partial [Pseudomonadota bacterium]
MAIETTACDARPGPSLRVSRSRALPFARHVLVAAVLALGVGVGGTATAEQARYIFGAKRDAVGQPAPIGSYAAGCLAGGQALAETGPGWQAMRLSRNRNWGHPAIVDYVQDLSAQVAVETSWNGLYV